MLLIRQWTKACCILMLCIILTCVSGFADQQLKAFTFVNPIWKGILDKQKPKKKSGGSLGKFQSFQSYTATVSSYDEFKLAMIKGMESRQANIIINYDPIISENESNEWATDFFGKSFVEDSDLFREVPWLYYAMINYTCNWSTELVNGQWFITSRTYSINYYDTLDQENALKKGMIETLIKIITPDMDMFEREKAIHDWIVNHVDYDFDTLNGTDDLGYTDYSAFARGKAVCEGYAELTDRMLLMAGIPAKVVDSRTMGHAWNMVNLYGTWYNLDVTWDDPTGGEPTLRYDYFNISDSQMSADHSWDKNKYPLTSDVAFDAGTDPGTIWNYCSIFNTELCKTELDCIKIGGEMVNGQCSLPVTVPDLNSDPVPVTGKPAPVGQNIVEITGNDRMNTPVNMGNIVTGGNQMQISLNFPEYQKAVDEYAAVQLPHGSLYFISLKGLTTNIVPYVTNTKDGISEDLISPFDICSLLGFSANGTWKVYILTVPTNGGNFNTIDWNNYDFKWYTFDVNCQ